MTISHPIRSRLIFVLGVAALMVALNLLHLLGVASAHAGPPAAHIASPVAPPAAIHAIAADHDVLLVAAAAPASTALALSSPPDLAAAGSGVPVITAPIVRGEVVDPIAVAQSGVESTWGTIETYGPLWGGALLVFAAVGAFLRRNAVTHWLAQGRVLAAITTASMLLLAVLTWRFRGGDTAGLLMSLYAAVLALIHPTVTTPAVPGLSSDAPTARLPQAGRARLTVLILLAAIAAGGGVALTTGCATVRPAAATGVDAGLSCEAPDVVRALTDLVPYVTAEVRALISGSGTVDKDALKADMAAIKSDLGRCAMAAAIAAASSVTAPAAPTSTRIAPAVDRADLRASFAAARAELGWAPVHLAGGEVL